MTLPATPPAPESVAASACRDREAGLRRRVSGPPRRQGRLCAAHLARRAGARAHHAKTSPATPPPRPKRSSPPLRSGSRPPARTLAPAAAATISTRTTRRNSPSSRPSCAKRWSAAAWPRRARSPYWPQRTLGLSQSHPAGLRCGREIPAIAAAARMRWFPSIECPIAAPLLFKLHRSPLRLRGNLPSACDPREIALFCDAAETALLASLFTAGAGKDRFDDFAPALARANSRAQRRGACRRRPSGPD